MAKHLPPRGSALPPWRASLLSALMWLILLTIFPARVCAQSILVKEDSIFVPTLTSVSLTSLIDNKVVEGVTGSDADYNVESSVSTGVFCNSTLGYFSLKVPTTTTITFTNKEDSGISFSIVVTAKNNPSEYVRQNLGTVYVGESKTILIPDEYLPLSEFTLGEIAESDDSEATFEIKSGGNKLTITGIAAGTSYLLFDNKFGDARIPITIAEKTTPGIIVTKDIKVAKGLSVSLKDLIASGVITNLPIDDADDYLSSCESGDLFCYGNEFRPQSLGTFTVTYTNSQNPDITFAIEVTVMDAIKFDFDSILIGQTKTVTVGENCLPLSDYSKFYIFDLNDNIELYTDTILKFEVDQAENQIVFTGLNEGKVRFFANTPYGVSFKDIEVLPATDDDKISVTDTPIRIPLWEYVGLKNLIEAGVVKGIPESEIQNYTASCAKGGMFCEGNRFRPELLGSYIITYTNTEDSNISFILKISVLNSIGIEVENIAVGSSKTIILESDALPLSEYKSFYLQGEEGVDPTTILSYEINYDLNQIILTGLSEGSVMFVSESKYGSSFGHINVVSATSGDSINVNGPISVLNYVYVYLPTLIKEGVIEGISEEAAADYTTSCDSSSVSCYSNYFRPQKTGTYNILFTNKNNPALSFSLEVNVIKAMLLGFNSLYVGESRTVTFADDCMPLSDYTSFYLKSNDDTDPASILEYNVDIEKNQITLKGIGEGQVTLYTETKYGLTGYGLTVRPAPIKVNGPISVLNYVYVYLSTLIKEGVIEGISEETAADYTTSCDSSSVVCYSNYFRPQETGTYNIQFTNKNNPALSFSLEINVIKAMLLGFNSLYVGESRTVTFADDCMPLSDYTSFYLKSNDDTDPASILEYNVDIEKNQITLKGIGEGQVTLYTETKYGLTGYGLTVKPLPIKVLEDSILVPTNNWISLSSLIKNKVVEGVQTISLYDIESSDPNIVRCDNTTGSFMFPGPGTATVTFTHKEASYMKLSIEVTARQHPGNYIKENLDTLYVGESKTLVIPDTYLPLDYFTSIEPGQYSDMPDADFDVEYVGNQITFRGEADGIAYLRFDSRFVSGTTVPITIKTRKAIVEVNEAGEATTGSQVDVPVALDLPEDVDLTPEEGMEIVCISADPGIAEVEIDKETGIITITPTGLGVTYITVRQQPITEPSEQQTRKATPLSRGGEDDLYTIEFWVTELELAEEMNLDAGSSEQLTYNVNAGDETYPYDIKPRWTSSNTAVAKVSADGTVTAVSEGSAVITLSTSIGTKQTIVNVEPDNTPAGSLSINPSDVTLTVGSRLSLSTKGADGKKVIWRTSDSFVAQIDENGVITGISSGTAIITATIEGTSTQATTRVTVFERTTGIEETEASEPVITVDNMTISVSGIDSDLPVEIYNVSGRLIASRKGSCSVAVGQTGIYIVRTGATARKVAVKH